MPETRSTFDATQYLDDTDCDIVNEYNSVIDALGAARDKYSKLMTRALKMKSALVAKQAELDQITRRHQRELAYSKDSADIARDKLRTQSGKLRKYKGESETLRRRNRQLAEDLRAVSRKVEQIKHLQCDICMDSFKNIVTRCGHGYCTSCLTTWLRPSDDDNRGDRDLDSMNTPLERCCPMCRKTIKAAEDVWPIYLESDGSRREVVCVESDSE